MGKLGHAEGRSEEEGKGVGKVSRVSAAVKAAQDEAETEVRGVVVGFDSCSPS